MMNKNIVLLKGDGIGPEIVNATVEVLNSIEEKYGHKFSYEGRRIGGDAYDNEGVPVTEETIEVCQKSDAVILGAVGGDKWDTDEVDPKLRPEQGLLKLRKELALYANLRPAVIYDALKEDSPLKARVIEDGVDLMIVRELIGGIYFGERKTYEEDGQLAAYDIEKYTEEEITRIGKMAFETAMGRRKKLTLVDKANVLDSSKLWRKIIGKMAEDYKEVEVNYMYVDNASMQLINWPGQFDVILTNNIFGDILSDEASMITGSLGMQPSASIGLKGVHMYEPIHGSAPDIAGKDLANPIGTILSAAMMLDYSFGMRKEAQEIKAAVNAVLEDGVRTKDIAGGDDYVSCSQIARLIAEKIKNN